ncbi:MAG: hypothetical protein HYU36_18425 [Planctomycetes bacterium]|nr:hypothetical protein [Planctomycetota bacterium]
MTQPEKKSPTEPLDLQRKIEDTVSGRRPIDSSTYPYFSPDYDVPFTHIGSEKQLFLDNFILDHLDGVERVILRPEKAEKPLLEWSNLPWEQAGFSPGVSSAIRDPDSGKFRMWYFQTLQGDPFNRDQVLCMAESDDAILWHKPLREDCVPFDGHKATNIVHRDVAASGLVLNHDRSDPARKYLMVYCPYGDARRRRQPILSRVAASPDGVHWTVISDDVPQRHQHETRVIWDEAIQQWIGYSQYSHHWHHGPRTRQIGRQTSPDFIHWSPKEVVLSVDWEPNLGPDREFHEASIRKIGGLYIAIVGEAHTESIWCTGHGGRVWRDQFHASLALYTSRDGRRFQRAGGPEPWVANGPPGSQDYGYACSSVAGGLVHDGRLIIPYSAIPHKQWVVGRSDHPTLVPESARQRGEHEMGMAKANGVDPGWPGTSTLRRAVGGLILREDGFASLKPSYEHGIATTKQFVFEGDTLRINADVSYGFIQVEVLDPQFKPYEGFAAANCQPVHGTGIWHTLAWKERRDLSGLWNKPVILAFHLHEASLCAFQFCSGD